MLPEYRESSVKDRGSIVRMIYDVIVSTRRKKSPDFSLVTLEEDRLMRAEIILNDFFVFSFSRFLLF